MPIEQRNEASFAFEKQWAEMRKDGELVPPRASFDPLQFVDFLPTLVLVEIDLVSKKMPIKFAGSAVRDFVGFELTGRDFLEYDSNPDPELGWQHRVSYHDQPCGRFEVLDIKFNGQLYIECAMTVLPLAGTNSERLVIAFVEPLDTQTSLIANESKLITETVKFGIYLDIGAGVPR